MSTTVCNRTAPNPSDPSLSQGAYVIDIRTVGGSTQNAYFLYGSTPPTPSITSVSPAGGPSSGGNTVTVTGTNFIPGRTVFTYNSNGSSMQATGVSCTTTKCTMPAPNGAPGPVDIVVFTSCAVSSAPCSGNARVSSSIPFTKVGAYAFSGLNVKPAAYNGGNGQVYVSESGHTASHTVALHTAPTANVHVTLTTPGGGGTLSTGSLDFTPLNWAQPQTVTITGVNNGITGDGSFSVVGATSSADAAYNSTGYTQPFTVVDNDSKKFFVSPQVGLFTTRAGGTATFTIVLTQAPSSTVTVRLASSDPSFGTVSPASLTFDTTSGGATSWNTARTVTVTGQNDGAPGTKRDYIIYVTSTSADGTYGNPAVLMQPDVTVSNIDAPATAGGLNLVRTGAGVALATWTNNTTSAYYKIKYSTTPGGAKTTLASSTSSGQVLSGLTVGQQYYFVISTVNAGNAESANSAEVPFIMYPPGPVGAFDGDTKSEMTYYKTNGEWKILSSIGGYVSNTTVPLGGAGYTPVPGDYDGDQRQDVAVYNGVTGAWIILKSSTNFTTSINVNWGGTGYLPEPGDYDGDGKTDPTVYRLSTGQWSVLTSSSNYTTTIVVNWGGGGYIPIPGRDFDGDFRADIAIYQQSTGSWLILKSTTNYTTTIAKGWGGVGYSLVPGDYDGDGKADMGLYKRSTGMWSILFSASNFTTATNVSWGGVGYLPVPGDYDGDARIDLGLFQVSTGNWYVLLSTTTYTTTLSVTAWGTSADRPISTAIFVGGDDASRAADFDADTKADITVYNSTSGAWSTLTSSSSYASALNKSFGGSSFTAVPGDYDGDGKADYGVYQNSTGNWSVLLSSSNYTTSLNKSAGGSGWTPIQGDYDGDGKTDFVAYNTTTGQWFGLKSSSNYTTTVSVSYGGTGYTAVVGDFDGDGKTDVGVYQGSTGNWSVLTSSSNYASSLSKSVGGAGYIPVQGDYDGDGKTDFVVYNTSTGVWYGLKSSTNYTTTINISWGGAGYTPVKGDYDGDGKTDLATYVSATGTWYVLLSSSNYTTSLSKALGGAGYVGLPQYP